MFALAGLLPIVFGFLRNFGAGSLGAVAAIASAVPPIVSAFLDFLDRVGKNPLMAFLFGAALFGAGGTLYGLTYDAPLRAKAEARAIHVANVRADAAIAKIRQEYERKFAEVQKRNKKR